MMYGRKNHIIIGGKKAREKKNSKEGGEKEWLHGSDRGKVAGESKGRKGNSEVWEGDRKEKAEKVSTTGK